MELKQFGAELKQEQRGVSSFGGERKPAIRATTEPAPSQAAFHSFGFATNVAFNKNNDKDLGSKSSTERTSGNSPFVHIIYYSKFCVMF